MHTSLSFLDLPLAVRHKVYAYAGLLRPCPIDLGAPPRVPSPPHESLGNQTIPARCRIAEYLLHPDGPSDGRLWNGTNYCFPNLVDCRCPGLPVALLLVSRAIYTETASLLIGRNAFILRAQMGSDLLVLQNMSQKTLSTMTSLLLRLNCWPCRRGHNEMDPPGFNFNVCQGPYSEANAVLDAASEKGKELLLRWTYICHQFSEVLPPGQLKLTFVCDVGDIETARAVVEPLRSFPILKRCTIRLGRHKDYRIRALAQEISAGVAKPPLPKPEPFLFEKLPRELRLQVLDFTDLGRDRTRHGYQRRYDKLQIYGGKLITFNAIGSRKRGCCQKCTDTFADCCCSSLHAAYSSSCVCRVLPLELFSVSKQMYADAVQVFYSKNPFELGCQLKDTLQFLHSLPKGARGFIRHLRFVFDEDDLRYWTLNEGANTWREIVCFIKDHFNVTNLSIVVDTAITGWEWLAYARDDPEYFHTCEREIYDVYRDLARPLHMISNLHDLYFDNGWFYELGPLLGKDIMGEKRYKDREIPEHTRGDGPESFAPKWWYEWPTTNPNPAASIRQVPVPPRPTREKSATRRGPTAPRGARGGRARG